MKWPKAWAIESVEAADKAYDGIHVGQAQLSADRTFVHIAIELPGGYADAEKAVAAERLMMPSSRLAQLLDTISGRRRTSYQARATH
jgi:hypothetical protein